MFTSGTEFALTCFAISNLRRFAGVPMATGVLFSGELSSGIYSNKADAIRDSQLG